MQLTKTTLAVAAASLLGVSILIACDEDDAEAPSATAPTASPAGTKRCGGACVPLGDPETGCTTEACAPCALAHASATCTEGCAVGACENGWGDCDGSPTDGCETDLSTASEHCGACGKACGPEQVCRAATCAPRAAADAEAWLASQTEGFCLDAYNAMLNLCGDVEFCFDARFMRAYPNGVALDLGVAWESETGNLASFGGDCDTKTLHLGTEADDAGTGGTLDALAFGRHLNAPLGAGKHLVSLQVNALGASLFLDGVRVATSGPPPSLQLLDACGPGLVIGQRMSYWWEAATRRSWNRMAVFLVHLREDIPDTARYSVAAATTPQPGSVFLFDGTTGIDGSRWAARVGGLVAVGKNAQDEDPQIDAGASGPLPLWKPLAQCALK